MSIRSRIILPETDRNSFSIYLFRKIIGVLAIYFALRRISSVASGGNEGLTFVQTFRLLNWIVELFPVDHNKKTFFGLFVSERQNCWMILNYLVINICLMDCMLHFAPWPSQSKQQRNSFAIILCKCLQLILLKWLNILNNFLPENAPIQNHDHVKNIKWFINAWKLPLK